MQLTQYFPTRPLISRILLVLAVAGVSIAGALPLSIGAGHAQSTTQAVVQVELFDEAGVLSASDEDFLRTETPNVTLPASVKNVAYVTFGTNANLLNDTVREFATMKQPHLATSEKDTFAPGQLIVAIGLEPRRFGVYCGDDVCEEIGMDDSRRLDGILDRMEPALRKENWAAAMLEGTKAAGDPSARRSGGSNGDGDEGSGRTVWMILGGILGGLLSIFALVGLFIRRESIKKLRSQYAELTRDYASVANRLKEIDIQAHSLSSPLANDRLRREWAEVKEGFLEVHEAMDQLSELKSDSPNRQFIAKRKPITQAHEKLTQMNTAEDNIERLSRMERGDSSVRRQELTDLHQDTLHVIGSGQVPELISRFEAMDQRILELREQLSTPHFMEDYAALLEDYQVLVSAYQQRLYQDSQVEESQQRSAPALWDSSWSPGHGYHGFVPAMMISTWHSNDVSAASAASSSSSTGYSSGGFSGGGGSRGF